MGNPRLYKKVPLYTKRELEIIRLICRGYGNKEMSDKLGLSIRTIESHREAIHTKAKVKGIARLVVYAIKNGIYKI